MLVTITFNNNYGAVPYTAASVKTPFATAGEALNYAFIKRLHAAPIMSGYQCANCILL